MGHQGTLGIATEATLELVPKPEAEFAAFFAFDDYLKAYRTVTASRGRASPRWPARCCSTRGRCEYLRRDDEAYIPQPEWVKGVVAAALYGKKSEVERRVEDHDGAGPREGGRYTGDEMSIGDWASRHDRYANPLHGRRARRQGGADVWHCEDADP